MSRGRPRWLIADGAWIVGGVALSALGTLVGLRIMTQIASPATFGALTLLLGVISLAMNLAATPLSQAAIHQYPAFRASGNLPVLRSAIMACVAAAAPWFALAIAIAAAIFVTLESWSWLTVLLVVLLLLSDCWRSLNLSLLNAARQQSKYSIWVVGDAWLRPLAAAFALVALGESVTLVIAAHLAVSLALNAILGRGAWDLPADGCVSTPPPQAGLALERIIWTYALPLVPLGIISWAISVGDRYFIGAILGLQEAGLYAAAYGLASAPFMMLGGAVEQAVRPSYQTAVSLGNHEHAAGLIAVWLGVVVAGCAAGVVVFGIWHELIARWMLGAPFRVAANLMPWIAAGYALRASSAVLERVCYAYAHTRRVLFIQSTAAIAALIIVPLATTSLGLAGAAMAVTASFSLQLLTAAVMAWRTQRNARHVAARAVPC